MKKLLQILKNEKKNYQPPLKTPNAETNQTDNDSSIHEGARNKEEFGESET